MRLGIHKHFCMPVFLIMVGMLTVPLSDVPQNGTS
jgi:hypothetical protein